MTFLKVLNLRMTLTTSRPGSVGLSALTVMVFWIQKMQAKHLVQTVIRTALQSP